MVNIVNLGYDSAAVLICNRETMKAKFVFSCCCEDMEVQFSRYTDLDFVPIEGMQFIFEPDPFELFVDGVMWYHNDGVLVVGFGHLHYADKEEFIEAVRVVIDRNEWQYRADKKDAEIIDMILNECAG